MSLIDIPIELKIPIMKMLPNRKASMALQGCCRTLRLVCPPHSLLYQEILERVILNENLSCAEVEHELANKDEPVTSLLLFKIYLEVHRPSWEDAAKYGVMVSNRCWAARGMNMDLELHRKRRMDYSEQAWELRFQYLGKFGSLASLYETLDTFWAISEGYQKAQLSKEAGVPQQKFVDAMKKWGVGRMYNVVLRLAHIYQTKKQVEEEVKLMEITIVALAERGCALPNMSTLECIERIAEIYCAEGRFEEEEELTERTIAALEERGIPPLPRMLQRGRVW